MLHRTQTGFAKRLQSLFTPLQSQNPQELLQTQMHQCRPAKRKKEPSFPMCTLASYTQPSSLLLAEQATRFGGRSHNQQLTLPKSRKARLQNLLHWIRSVRGTLFCWLCTSRVTTEPPKQELGLFLEEPVLPVLRSTKTDPTVFEFSCSHDIFV